MTEAQCRRIVRARSDGKCEHCLVRRATSMSHRKPRSQGGRWSPENIADSCGDGTTGCHGWIEHNPGSAHDFGWRLWRIEEPAEALFLLGGRLPVLLTSGGGYERLVAREEAAS